jgi:hypothetical protein
MVNLSNLDNFNILWKKHALQRMLERSISRSEVKNAIIYGKIIEEYHDDFPHPSHLIAYIETQKPLHVVFSINTKDNELFIITAYEPDLKHFEKDYITRRAYEK